MNDPEGGRLRGLLRNPAAQHAGAFLLYLAIWLVAVGPKILPHMSSWTLSSYPNEPSVFVWSLEWWAHPFSHGANPLLSSTVWAPTGLNLAWVATSPAPGLVAAPITIPFGPVVSFNVLSLVTPPLTAWTTYLLARHVTRVFPAALVGGYLFGFSPVVMREIELGHLNLSMLFLLPLAAYLVVRRLDGTIGPRAFVALLTALLVFEFGIFTEILATMTLVGLVVGAVAWLLASADLRRRLAGAAVLVAVSFAVAAAVISPYLYTAFAHPQAVKPATFEGLAVGAKSTSDLTRYVLPRPGFAIGPGVRHRPDLNWWYFGVPLLLLLVLFWVEGWRTFAARLLGLGFLISLVLSIGSKLPVGGIPFPWAALEKLPLLDRARPGRIIAYAFLFAAISAAVWAAKGRTKTVGSVLRWLLVAAAAVAIVPNFGAPLWTRNLGVPPLFSTNRYRAELCPGETAMVVDKYDGDQLYWQAETGMYFRTATWYSGFRPANYVGLKTALRLGAVRVKPSDQPAIRRFISNHRVSVILLRGAPGPVADRLASMLGVTPRAIGGVTLLRVAICGSSAAG
ncbi:MAG TPA: hypothetical protein VGA30_11340 [Actinomycetota bacterium]